MAKTGFKNEDPKAKPAVKPAVNQEKDTKQNKKKFNAKDMIIYSEIMNPKF